MALGAAPADDPWTRVQAILSGTKDVIVLDGTEKAPLRYTEGRNPAYGDWLVRFMLSDPVNFNPFTSSDAGVTRVQQYVFESLLDVEDEPPYALVGHVAKAYPTVSDDRLQYTFELRDDVRFQDGKPLAADDVLFSMKVILNPRVMAPHLRNYYASVRNLTVDGKHRVTFHCREAYFRNDLMLSGFKLLPKHFYDPDGLMDPVPIASLIDGSWEKGAHADRVQRFADAFNQEFNRKMMGSGPYYVEDWERDIVTLQKVVLTRNPDYWGREKEGVGPSGYVDKVVFKIINNTDAAFIELTNGNLDYHTLSALEFKDKSWSPEFMDRFMKGIEYGTGYNYIGWNNTRPIFQDKRVRKALTHLTDRESMVQNLLFGLGETVEGPIHKFRPEYNHDLAPYPYDPDRALDLLEEAGWSDTDGDGVLDKVIDGVVTPFRFEFLVNSGNQLRKDIALVVQAELQDVGIECEVRELDWSIFLDRVKNKNYDAMTLGWTGSLRVPPDGFQIWHSSQAEGIGSNHIGFRNAEVDSILEAYRREFDMGARVALYRRFQEILHEEQPYTFLWKQRVARAYSRRFQNVNWYPPGADTQEWWVEPTAQVY